MEQLRFSVDAALIRELGERLVGRPHIALSELIKNSYDADATHVEVAFELAAKPAQLVVSDDGHGMAFEAFRDYWMRVGSPHKQARAFSPAHHRRLTGSKGIGRLAAQFLASKIELRTRADGSDEELHALLDWRKAAQAGNLTEATVEFELRPSVGPFAGGAAHGTELILSGLQQQWSPANLEQLAQEIWPLQPPFGQANKSGFGVSLSGLPHSALERFNAQMQAVLELWDARITGSLRIADDGTCATSVDLRFADGSTRSAQFGLDECALHEVDFEVRVFRLAGRQPLGIQVDKAREYLRRFGGIHVYDAGFHLPYYGPEADWLQIEMDHSHRMSRSRLLPEDLQVPEGLNYLPTNSRLYGVVNVDTALERRLAGTDSESDALAIQVSRDRLLDNASYRALRHTVRWAIDYYAMQVAARELNRVEARRDVEPVTDKTTRALDVLERYRADVPQVVYRRLVTELRGVDRASRAGADILERQTGLLGALATAGISALAIEHEVRKHLRGLDRIAASLAGAEAVAPGDVATQIRQWTRRIRDTRRLFAPLADAETATSVERLDAKSVVRQVVDAVSSLTPGVTYDYGNVGTALMLPPATLAEWFSMLQNVILNAANATLEAPIRQVLIRDGSTLDRTTLWVDDTGVGVDLGLADDLFQPFVRKLELTPERRYLGLGGSGLGLTIVRIIARNRKVRVRFVEAPSPQSTRFEFSWKTGS